MLHTKLFFSTFDQCRSLIGKALCVCVCLKELKACRKLKYCPESRHRVGGGRGGRRLPNTLAPFQKQNEILWNFKVGGSIWFKEIFRSIPKHFQVTFTGIHCKGCTCNIWTAIRLWCCWCNNVSQGGVDITRQHLDCQTSEPSPCPGESKQKHVLTSPCLGRN